ncbi:MAG: NPCBM/NEW2 domain-containing protein, partial [Planctomycetia bacterium]
GQLTLAEHAGQLPGSRTVREPFVQGIRQEQFTFVAPEAGTALLRRRWHFDGTGQVLHVSINGGAEQRWNLGPGQDNAPGVRETMFVLSGCRAGENVVSIRSDAPVNASGYRVEPLVGGEVPLVRLGAINARQSRGRFLNHVNASGAPLSIGNTTYDDGIGTHATSFIEYPLAGQFERFEVTCGIDGSTEGRGSVVFRVYVDGKLRADTGVINGFDAAKSLTVDGLGAADRLILSVTEAGDGDRHDLANWVDGRLVLRSGAKPGTPAEK